MIVIVMKGYRHLQSPVDKAAHRTPEATQANEEDQGNVAQEAAGRHFVGTDMILFLALVHLTPHDRLLRLHYRRPMCCQTLRRMKPNHASESGARGLRRALLQDSLNSQRPMVYIGIWRASLLRRGIANLMGSFDSLDGSSGRLACQTAGEEEGVWSSLYGGINTALCATRSRQSPSTCTLHTLPL